MEKTKVEKTDYVYVTFDAQAIARVLENPSKGRKRRGRARAESVRSKRPDKSKA
jgi:hypothetical protein